MPKRKLFKELKDSLENVKDYEHGKITLKTSTIKPQERKILALDGKVTDVFDDDILAKEVEERINDGDEPIKVNIDDL